MKRMSLPIEVSNGPRQNSRGETAARGMAFFLGGFAALNVIGELRAPGFDANLWWIDLHWLGPVLVRVVLALAAICLAAFAWRLPRSAWRRRLTLGCAGLLCLGALVDSVQFYVLLARGTIRAGIPVASSLFIAAALGLIFRAAWGASSGGGQASGRFIGLRIAGVFLACAVGFPILQMLCFGRTDYRRPADVAVVLGARVYADGRPSEALADRVRTACQLYRDGLVRKLIVSGGPGDGAVHETEAMRRLAVRLGVRAEDIVADPAGLNTQATVRHTEVLFHQLHASRVLVVSHFYHLPRIKLAYQRAGCEVYTVPARENPLFLHPGNLGREVPAFWVYYLRPSAS